MSDKIKIEVNGTELEARPGQMLIEVTDAAGIYVPRFCYHEKLSVAANCRMCLVEVEKAPKPLPACATPVADGMKVFTKSPYAIDAQKSVMEFLLINHPLDCPICDQGGECELQDLAMGFGRSVSRFTERKRVVRDKNLGPLVSTDMTRCIHCTRCVRFGQEIAGIQELGTIGRGERTEISTYIERSVDHELSGNIIDVCPVGALNSKPYRYSARAWEMVERPSIAPHDCFGSNLNVHVLRGKVKRVVPRANEAINETWLSDRDRFSYEGIYAADRARRPMIRVEGEWRETGWDEALQFAADGLGRAGADVGALISPSATTEEAYVLARLIRHLGANNIDHRLRRRDFRQQELDPVFPGLPVSLEAVDSLGSALIVGSNLRHEVPLFAHRIRKAALKGARIAFLNPEAYEYLFDVTVNVASADLVADLAAVVAAAAGDSRLSPAVETLVGSAKPEDSHHSVADALRADGSGLVILGHLALRHPRFAELRLLAAELARLTGHELALLPEGANTAGVSLAGAVPHRAAGGRPVEEAGRHAGSLLRDGVSGLVLFGVEPGPDCGVSLSDRKGFIVACSPWASEDIRACADVILPIGTFAETAGTFVNVAGRWQSFNGVANAFGESRPGWKVLRVLGNLLEMADCEYTSAEQIRDELRSLVDPALPVQAPGLDEPPERAGVSGEPEIVDVPMYEVDGLVRRAPSLQFAAGGRGAEPAQASRVAGA